MSSRRTVVPASGSFTSVRSIVAASTLSRQGAPVHATYSAPPVSSLIPYGFASGVFVVTSVMAPRRIETADHVAQLTREPRNALPVEDERVWIVRLRVGHLVDGDLTGLRIEIAERTVLVARVADIAPGIDLDGVRHRVGRQRIFLHLASGGIDTADQRAELPGPPDQAVGGLRRIAGALTECRCLACLERHLHGA